MRIAHYMQGIGARGGIATYIRRISKAQIAGGNTIYYMDTLPFDGDKDEVRNFSIVVKDDKDLFIQAKEYELDIIHLHTNISVRPPENISLIRTIHNNNPYCPSGTRYLKRWGIPCDRAYSLGGCLWGHFVDHCGSVRPNKLYAEFERTWQEKDTLREITIIANSQFVKNQMIRSGYKADAIHVLHLPAPEIKEYFPPPHKDLPHFVYLGRITPEKGFVWLLKALAEVKVPFHVDIAGTGNQVQEKAIRTLAESLGLTDKITFHGWVNEAKAIQLIQKARALVFPSVWHEPAGFVSLEAAAAGRAVIASKVGGIPEYADRLKNALLVEPNDVNGLALSIEKLATDWSLAECLGKVGKEMVKQHFLLENHLEKLINLYQSVMNNGT